MSNKWWRTTKAKAGPCLIDSAEHLNMSGPSDFRRTVGSVDGLVPFVASLQPPVCHLTFLGRFCYWPPYELESSDRTTMWDVPCLAVMSSET